MSIDSALPPPHDAGACNAPLPPPHDAGACNAPLPPPHDAGACNAPLPLPPPYDAGACNAPLPDTAGAGDAPLRVDLPQRRSVRLPGYDYSQAGWYFVTIVADDRRLLFGGFDEELQLRPTPLGTIVSFCWHEFAAHYAAVHADCWVLMPNHVHLLIGLLPTESPKSLGQLIGAFKATCTRRAQVWRGAGSIWQHLAASGSEATTNTWCVRRTSWRFTGIISGIIRAAGWKSGEAGSRNHSRIVKQEILP